MPEKAKRISIFCRNDGGCANCGFRFEFTLAAPLDKIYFGIQNDTDAPYDVLYSPALTSNNVQTVLSACGEFVEHLAFDYYDVQYEYYQSKTLYAKLWRSSASMIRCCQNLKKLSLGFLHFSAKQIFELTTLIETVQIEELYLKRCYGFTNVRRHHIHEIAHFGKQTSKLVKLTLCTSEDPVYSYFLNYFTNLTSLTITFDVNRDNEWRIDNLAKILNNNCHCLQHLKLLDLYCLEGYETTGTLITDKFAKLESLELEIALNDDTKYMIDLPHIKSLILHCKEYTQCINAHLRTHSEAGYIEELIIYGGTFNNTEPPLLFNKLRKFGWDCKKWSGFWKAIIEWQMPELQSIHCRHIEAVELGDFSKFVESKNNLELIEHYVFPALTIPLTFRIQIIRILKETKPKSLVTFAWERKRYVYLLLSFNCCNYQ